MLWESYLAFFSRQCKYFVGVALFGPPAVDLAGARIWAFRRVPLLARGCESALLYSIASLFGTWGAFIRIRSSDLFAEWVCSISESQVRLRGLWCCAVSCCGRPVLAAIAAGAAPQSFVFGTPLAVAVARVDFVSETLEPSRIFFTRWQSRGWAGLLATAMNLLPIGQLDGGHILYTPFSASAGTALFHVPSMLFWRCWVSCTGPGGFGRVLMFFLFRRHPLVYDERPLPAGRGVLCAAAALIFLLSLSIVPIRTS